MKILMLGWELPPHNSGGLGVACLNLSKSLAKMGADIDFVVPYEAEHNIDYMRVLAATHIDPLFRYGGGSAYESEHIEVKRFQEITTHKLYSIRDIQKDYCRFVDRYLMEYKPDVVHAHDWLTYEAGILAKKNYGIPLVAHVHATEYDRGGETGGNPAIHQIEREGLLWADKIIAVSNTTKDIIVKKYDIPADKIDVAYNGFTVPENDDYHFDGSSYQYLENLKKRGYTVVSTVGRFTLQKGLFHLMRAAARAISIHPKMVFLFAGDGEQKDELMRMSADLGISSNVIFTGFIRGKQLRDIYSISDVFVMSSVSEPFGLTALEAAHHGNALVITRQSGVGEVLNSIVRYDFWDEDKLAGALVNIAESPALDETLRDGVKREYTRISWDDVAKKCLNVYDEVQKHKRNRF